jgi:hypothetical protein
VRGAGASSTGGWTPSGLARRARIAPLPQPLLSGFLSRARLAFSADGAAPRAPPSSSSGASRGRALRRERLALSRDSFYL